MLEAIGALVAVDTLQRVFDCALLVVRVSPRARTASPVRKPEHETDPRARAGTFTRSSLFNDGALANRTSNGGSPVCLKILSAAPLADLRRLFVAPAVGDQMIVGWGPADPSGRILLQAQSVVPSKSIYRSVGRPEL